MKRVPILRLIFLFFLSLLVSNHSIAQTKRGVKVKTKAQVARFEGAVYDDLWAVVIGIDKYEHWDRLEYAVNDAKSVRTLLQSNFGFRSDHIIELLDQKATLINIRTTLGGVMPQRTKKNDGVLVFFAGHGETVDLPGGGNLGYLVPYEGSTEKSEYFATLLPMTQLREICNLIPAKHVFFVIDACYSGLAAVSERGMNNETKQYVAKLASMRSRQVLTAGGRGEPVVEKAEWGHSAFTYKFLEGLESGSADADQDGVITSGEIATYIKSRVPRITDNKQTPQFKNLSNDEGEFVFLFPTKKKGTQKGEAVELPEDSGNSDELLKELEAAKKEIEKMKQQQKDTGSDTKKEEKKNDEIFTPPP